MAARSLVAFALLTLPLAMISAAESATETEMEHVLVTSTPIPEDPYDIPASVTVLDGNELRGWGLSDLRSGLRLVAGVDIAAGGDGGPASSVPELWGLKEFDAFLLVVDGVPWGGAFNPELSTLSLKDVKRVEIIRGAAPVMYGATSFVGVIHVLHNDPGDGKHTARLAVGSRGSADANVAVDVPSWLGFGSRVILDGEHREFSDPRTQFDRAHVLWRNLKEIGKARLSLDLDYAYLGQDPASPHPREGGGLATTIPLDANHNPGGSFINPRRGAINVGFARPVASGRFNTLFSASRTVVGSLRGFLVDFSADPASAHGFREDVGLTEFYLDSRYETVPASGVSLVVGLDHLHGSGSARGGDFDYTVARDGSSPPDGQALASQAEIAIGDRRDFSGLYGYVAWTPPESRWRVEAGARLNRARESRDASTFDFTSSTLVRGESSRTTTRASGSVGATFTAWERKDDSLRIFGDYRNTFKPAAMDFGLDADPEILDPETAQSYELGVKTRMFDRRLEIEVSAFQMSMKNMVVSQDCGGNPCLVNAGSERFRGGEVEVEGRVLPTVFLRGNYSLHDARFRDFVQDFGGVNTQLEGKRIEMSPHDLASVGVLYARPKGFNGHADVQYVGARYLNKRNTALTPSYTTWSAGVGYRLKGFELRLDGQNLNDQRPPTAESELGDAQYYRLYARHVEASVRWDF